MDKKYNEKIIIKDGKPVYAISIEDKKSNKSSNSNHIYIYNGQVTFSDSWYSNASEFNFSDEAHQIAKEIFISQLQVDIKKKVLELKQLESIFREIGLSECFGTVLVDNTKLLLDLKDDINLVNKEIQTNFQEVKQISDKVESVKSQTKETVETVIKENIKPIALNKKKKETTTTIK